MDAPTTTLQVIYWSSNEDMFYKLYLLVWKFDSHSHRKMVCALTTSISQYKTIHTPVCHLMSGVHSIFMSGQSSVFFPPLFITLNLAIFSFYSTNVADKLESQAQNRKLYLPFKGIFTFWWATLLYTLPYIKFWEIHIHIHHSYFKFLQEKMIIKLSMFYSG